MARNQFFFWREEGSYYRDEIKTFVIINEATEIEYAHCVSIGSLNNKLPYDNKTNYSFNKYRVNILAHPEKCPREKCSFLFVCQ